MVETEEGLYRIGLLIDAASDNHDAEGLQEALGFVEILRQQPLVAEQEALVWYFVGNAWAGLRFLRTATPDLVWAWEQPEVREEIIAFRQAAGHEGYGRLDRIRRCQIPTNLANLFSTTGRFVDAIEWFDRALHHDDRFGMALGNKARCLANYARALYDPGHRCVFAGIAKELLEQAIVLPLEGENTRAGFRALHADLERVTSGHTCSDHEHLHGFPLGDGDEARFRSWALRERLFVNPLNDLGPFAIAARDVLHVPTMRVPLEVGTAFHGFYNQLKQEYATARWLLFDGLEARERHFADRDLVLLDTLDSTALGFAVEKLKLAFRSAYSLLDKVAVFLASYFGLSTPMERVNFRTVWYRGGKQKDGLLAEFKDRANWPLRGLFWLAKDLHQGDAEFHAAIEPDAAAVALLRNRLEHQYVKVTERPRVQPVPPLEEPPPDPLAYRVERSHLEAKALRMMKVARSALIYLSLTLHEEERKSGFGDSPAVRGELPILL